MSAEGASQATEMAQDTADAQQNSTFWETLTQAWDKIDDVLAGWFGFKQSKYQWAVDEYHYQKQQEEINSQIGEDNIAMEQFKQDDRLEAQPLPRVE